MSVIVGFCHPQGSITPQFRRSLTMVYMRDAARTRHIVGEIDKEASMIAAGRNEIVLEFLDRPGKPDWLWMVDSDMTFGDKILERLLANADPKERPILGGLCFGVRPARDAQGREFFNDCLASPLELFPTIYMIEGAENRMVHWGGYPPDSVIQVASTGAACLLIHRSVLADPRWRADGHPLPWFRDAVLHGKLCSEDHFFHMKAGSLGYPIHVDTGAKTGHVKTFVADEELYLAQRATPAPSPVAEMVDI